MSTAICGERFSNSSDEIGSDVAVKAKAKTENKILTLLIFIITIYYFFKLLIFKNLKNVKKINTTKFLDSNTLKSHKNLLGLYEKISSELMSEVVRNLSLALKNHDKIEDIYISAMDYKKVNKKS